MSCYLAKVLLFLGFGDCFSLYAVNLSLLLHGDIKAVMLRTKLGSRVFFLM